MRSLGAMDAGDWERAAELLKGMSRRSPFAPWRVFCKAMVCFGAGDDQGLRRALELLPADFALAHTVAEWRRLCTDKRPERTSSTIWRRTQAHTVDESLPLRTPPLHSLKVSTEPGQLQSEDRPLQRHPQPLPLCVSLIF